MESKKLQLYKKRLQEYSRNVKLHHIETRIFAIVFLVFWILTCLACGCLFFLSLYWYPQQGLKHQNLKDSATIQWTGGQNPNQPGFCSQTCKPDFTITSGQNISKNFSMPAAWDMDTSTMSDLTLTFEWGALFNASVRKRMWMEIYSNDVRLSSREIPNPGCGNCVSTTYLLEYAFHPTPGENKTIWQMKKSNDLSFSIFGEPKYDGVEPAYFYITYTKLEFRWDTGTGDLNGLINRLYYAAIATAFLAALIPVALGTQLCRVVCTNVEIDEQEWVNSQIEPLRDMEAQEAN